MGEKSVAEIVNQAKAMNILPMEFVHEIVHGGKTFTGIKPAMKKNLTAFLAPITELTKMARSVSMHSSDPAHHLLMPDAQDSSVTEIIDR